MCENTLHVIGVQYSEELRVGSRWPLWRLAASDFCLVLERAAHLFSDPRRNEQTTEWKKMVSVETSLHYKLWRPAHTSTAGDSALFEW